jgi:hypothetical protein
MNKARPVGRALFNSEKCRLPSGNPQHRTPRPEPSSGIAAADLAAARQALHERWLESRTALTAAMAREARHLREDQSRIELIAEIYGFDDPEVLAHQERARRYQRCVRYLRGGTRQ